MQDEDVIKERELRRYLHRGGKKIGVLIGKEGDILRPFDTLTVEPLDIKWADDKAIYSYMPEIIEFYTGRAPILKNVQTYSCRNPDELQYVLEHLDELVVKEVHGSGGYGMLVGPAATQEEIEIFRMKLEARPERYIAQPTLPLSLII